MNTHSDSSIDLLSGLTPLWWQGTIVFFLVGDILTTLSGYHIHTIVEASPLAAWLINTHGLLLIVPLKIAVVAGFYVLYRIVPHPHRVGVPLGLCMLGFVVTVWNGAVIVAALL